MAGKGRRRSAGRGGRGGGFRGIVGAVVGFLVAVALIISVCRALGIHDVQSLIAVARGSVNPTSQAANGAVDKAMKGPKCNMLEGGCGSNPVQDPGGGAVTKPSAPNVPDANAQGSRGESATGLAATLKGIAPASATANAPKFDIGRYPHWTMVDGSCDTRDVVLRNAGFSVSKDACRPQSRSGFTYSDPYTGDRTGDPDSLVIDHAIPLEYADAHGGSTWSADRRTAFANDTALLRAVSAKTEKAKGSNGPAKWMPTDSKARCSYAEIWVDGLSRYGLSVDSADRQALSSALASCAG